LLFSFITLLNAFSYIIPTTVNPVSFTYIPKWEKIIFANYGGFSSGTVFSSDVPNFEGGSISPTNFIDSTTLQNQMYPFLGGLDYEDIRDILCIVSNSQSSSGTGFSTSNTGKVTVWSTKGTTPVLLFEVSIDNPLSVELNFDQCVIQPITSGETQIVLYVTEQRQGSIFKVVSNSSGSFVSPFIDSDPRLAGNQTTSGFPLAGIRGIDYFTVGFAPFLIVTYADIPGYSTLFTVNLGSGEIIEVAGFKGQASQCVADGVRFALSDKSKIIVACRGNSTEIKLNVPASGQTWQTFDHWKTTMLFAVTNVDNALQQNFATDVGQIGDNFFFLANQFYDPLLLQIPYLVQAITSSASSCFTATISLYIFLVFSVYFI